MGRNKAPAGPLKFLHPDTEVVFLALTWFGPRAMSLADMRAMYDFLNHDVLADSALEVSLNTLLSAGLIEAQSDNTFLLKPGVHDQFEQFKRRRRRDRFETAKMFIRRHDWQDPPPRVIRLTKADTEDRRSPRRPRARSS